MPYTPPPDYSVHQQARAEEIKRAQQAQEQWQNAEKLRLQKEAERTEREREAGQRVQQNRMRQRI